MKTKAFIWVMVTLLGVAMTTAGSCDSSRSYSLDAEGADTASADTTPAINDNPKKVDKSTIEAFKKYNDRLYKEIQGQDSYTEKEEDTIIAYAGYILDVLPSYEEKIKKIGNAQSSHTGMGFRKNDFVKLAHDVEPYAKDFQACNDSVLAYLNGHGTGESATSSANIIIYNLPTYKDILEKIRDCDEEASEAASSSSTDEVSDSPVADLRGELECKINNELESQRRELTSEIKMLALALSVGSILLVVALVVTIVYFHNKLKKVSQSLAAAGPAVQENAGKETRTANGKVQKEMNNLRQHLDNVESQVKRVSASIGNLEYRLNQSYPQPAPPTLQPAPLTPQPASPTPPMNNGICLYAELDAASNGGLLYKAQPTRTANSLYEITLTQPGATVGSFRVLEDCTILANVLRNRNSYLAACTFNGNDNATKIVNEAPGAVSKQQDGTWLVTQKAKIKLS